MNEQYWSWILTAVGITGFILAGRKVWWCWYINIACQVLWFAYAIITQQYGFIVAAVLYTYVFSQNAWRWTKEHKVIVSVDTPKGFVTIRGDVSPEQAAKIQETFRHPHMEY